MPIAFDANVFFFFRIYYICCDWCFSSLFRLISSTISARLSLTTFAEKNKSKTQQRPHHSQLYKHPRKTGKKRVRVREAERRKKRENGNGKRYHVAWPWVETIRVSAWLFICVLRCIFCSYIIVFFFLCCELQNTKRVEHKELYSIIHASNRGENNYTFN